MSIHSFIMWVFIAPVLGYYSEAFPTLARPKYGSFKGRLEYVRAVFLINKDHHLMSS